MDEIEGLPREYLEVLREIATDDSVRDLLPHGVAARVETALGITTDPTPSDPRDTERQSLSEDDTARDAELAERVRRAVDDWYDDPSNSAGRLGGIPADVLDEIRASELRAMMSDLQTWSRRHH
jgi:hypothetical protein